MRIGERLRRHSAGAGRQAPLCISRTYTGGTIAAHAAQQEENMRITRKYRRLRPMLTIGTAAALTILVAACGSSSSSSSSTSSSGGTSATTSGSSGNAGLAEAQKMVAAASHYPTKIGPSVPIGKPVPTGKTIDYIECGATACQSGGIAFAQAAKVLGWHVVDIQAQPTPPALQAAMDQAIRNKPDGVVISGSSTDQFPRQLQELASMHIPVIGSHATEDSGQGGWALVLPDKEQV